MYGARSKGVSFSLVNCLHISLTLGSLFPLKPVKTNFLFFRSSLTPITIIPPCEFKKAHTDLYNSFQSSPVEKSFSSNLSVSILEYVLDFMCSSS